MPPSSAGTNGAASAAPLVSPEEARELLASCSTADEVYALLLRVQRSEDDAQEHERTWSERRRALAVERLRIERRWGELLGPPQTGRPSRNVTTCNVSSGAQRAAIARARAIAPRAIPDEAFEAYVSTTPRPTYRGLRSAHGAPTTPRGPRRRRSSPESAPEPERTSGRRLHGLYRQRRQDPTALIELQINLMRTVGVLEGFAIDEVGIDDHERDLVLDLRRDLGRLREWLDRADAVVSAALGDQSQQRRLLALRTRAEDPSSTENERMMARQAYERAIAS